VGKFRLRAIYTAQIIFGRKYKWISCGMEFGGDETEWEQHWIHDSWNTSQNKIKM
jgi:hypothetical protein